MEKTEHNQTDYIELWTTAITLIIKMSSNINRFRFKFLFHTIITVFQIANAKKNLKYYMEIDIPSRLSLKKT